MSFRRASRTTVDFDADDMHGRARVPLAPVHHHDTTILKSILKGSPMRRMQQQMEEAQAAAAAAAGLTPATPGRRSTSG